MIGERPHAGPAIGDHVTITHDASGSVVHGTVRLRAGLGLIVDADGCVVELDREGWHVTCTEVAEPPNFAVVVDRDGDAWQRRMSGRWHQAGDEGAWKWADVQREFGPLELVWEPRP